MSSSRKFLPNKAGMAKLQRDLEKKFSAGIHIPLDGPEADAVADVKKQMKGMGLTPNDAEVRKMVRDTRD